VTHALYLVRHGESEWNLRRLTQGQTAYPKLTKQGAEQAMSAAAVLTAELARGATRRHRLVSSDLVRAVETAQIIGARLGAEVELDPRLREQGLGRLEGRGYEETWAAAEEHDWSDPTLPVGGGESVAELHARIGSALDEVTPDSSTVLVSHGDALRAALTHVSGVQPGSAPWVEVPNGAVFRVLPGGRWERLWSSTDSSLVGDEAAW
jgi:probable phosphoglycerate mutase